MVTSNGVWASVIGISMKRSMTKCGEDHLSDHGKRVLIDFVQKEQQSMMSSALGGGWAQLLKR